METFSKGDAIILCILLVLGLLSYIISYILKIRSDFSIKIFNEFLKVREPLTIFLSEISSRKIDRPINSFTLEEWREYLSKIYYKNFDFFPTPVLDEILCLINCIERKGDYLIIHTGDVIKPMDKAEIEKAVYAVGTNRNFRTFVFANLGRENNPVNRNIRLLIQTRLVLRKINNYFNLRHLIKLSKT